jgi:acyl carrier protein phosphodiesterase
MNFLAHLYLSGDNVELMVGNFIGDFVKGRNALETFEREIATGIELHRAIDVFTDTHAVVTQSKQRLRPKYRHYSGVIVDVFYDHFLAKNWNVYHNEPLPDFAAKAYTIIKGYDAILPASVKHMLPYMINGNWLVNYANIEGIRQALSGMSRRTPYDSKMDEAAADLSRYYSEFKEEFDSFFPVLASYCHAKIKELTQGRA